MRDAPMTGVLNKAESLLDANIAKSRVSYLLIQTDDWGV